jgi:hypothetical protein
MEWSVHSAQLHYFVASLRARKLYVFLAFAKCAACTPTAPGYHCQHVYGNNKVYMLSAGTELGVKK